MAFAARQVVNGKARFDGRSLAEWVPEAVDRIVAACQPTRIVMFGSVARNDDGPDSDIDLLVILDDDVDRQYAAKSALRAVAAMAPEVEIVVVGEATARANGGVPGTIVRPALSEGTVVYDRDG